MKLHQLKNSYLPLALTVAVVGVIGLMLTAPRGHSSEGPTQAVSATAPKGKQVATFAAGCFWSMQAIFQQLKGVERVDPGYAGGVKPHPSYEQVENGDTGYAESANITFDPNVISYQELLQVLLTVRNPTTLNRQGPDEGTQYRSVIFYHNPTQKLEALAAIRNISASHLWSDPIVTTVQPFTKFYRAEDYHLDYYNRHPDEPYCATVIAPEIADFREKFKGLLKE